MEIKFKRVIEGWYKTEYKGYTGEVSKNHDEGNWSWEVYDPQGYLIDGDVTSTYKDGKWSIREMIEEGLSK